jgi:hypothetical protein|tara:strand:- start:1348 stop:1590 length:243 start_codon:yes stop_codon:yes gene_type:complete
MKGPSIALILGGAKSIKHSKEEGHDDYKDAFDDAAQECLSAVKDGDDARFADSLKDCIEICLEAREGNPGKQDDDDGEGY